jgi:hypothetical protein
MAHPRIAPAGVPGPAGQASTPPSQTGHAGQISGNPAPEPTYSGSCRIAPAPQHRTKMLHRIVPRMPPRMGRLSRDSSIHNHVQQSHDHLAATSPSSQWPQPRHVLSVAALSLARQLFGRNLRPLPEESGRAVARQYSATPRVSSRDPAPAESRRK